MTGLSGCAPKSWNRIDRRSFLLAAVAAAGCGRTKRAGVRALSVALGSYHTMSPFYLAYERGYFRDAGFDIAIHVARSSTEAMPLLAQGTLDVGFFSNSAALVNLIAQGAKVRIAAAREFISDCYDVGALYERKARFPAGDGDAEAWRGKRVAIQSRGAIADFAFDAVRRQLAVPDDAIHRLYLDRAASVAALLSGGADAIVNGFAFPIDLGERQGEFRRNDTAPRLLRGMQYSYLLFSRNLLDADPDLGADFIRAYLRGTREYLGGATPDFLERWIRENGMDRDTVMKSCRDTFVLDGSVRLEDLQKYLDWLAGSHYAQAAKAETMTDLRSLNRVHRSQS